MIDFELFAMGGGITFIALAGAYAYLRDRYLEGTRRAAQQIERRRHRSRRYPARQDLQEVQGRAE
jgi:hypothetical protein